MTATVAQLGARALRRLGVAIVPNAQRPADGPTYAQAEVVKRVMRSLGMPYTEAERPALLGTVGQAEIAQRALRSLGVNPVADAPDMGATVAQSEIALRALRAVGVVPADLTLSGSGEAFSYVAIATSALRKLGVVDAEETPSGTDQAYAEQRTLAVHDMLWGQAYVTWHAEAIPGWVAEAYVAMTANLLAPAFGRPSSPETAQMAQEMVRQQALLGAGRIASDRAVARVQAVHDALIAEGLGDWTLNAIPSAVADDYVTLTVAEIAPVHGKAVDAAASMTARAHVRRIVLSGDRGLTLALDKVYAAHDQLVQAGVVAWSVSAVPIAHAEDYAGLVTAMLAPVYGGQGSAEAFDAVVGKMRRMAQMRDMEERTVEKVRSTHDELSAMGIVSWGLDAIPGAMVDAYATMATALMAPDPGKPADPAVIEMAHRRVYRALLAGPVGQGLAEEKVRAVHASLTARGRARWTLANVPLYAEEPYVVMATVLLARETFVALAAPDTGVKIDPGAGAAAEMELIRIVSVPSSREPVRAVYF